MSADGAFAIREIPFGSAIAAASAVAFVIVEDGGEEFVESNESSSKRRCVDYRCESVKV